MFRSPIDELPSRLKEVMSAHGISPNKLAEAIGCSDVAIYKILSGQTRRSRLLPTIAKILNVSLDWLIGRGDRSWQVPVEMHNLLPPEADLVDIFQRILAQMPEQIIAARYASHLAQQFPRALADFQTNPINAGLQTHSQEPTKESESNAIPSRIIRAMNEQKISQKKLAQAAGCSQVTISRILSGNIRSSRRLADIACALNIDYEWLIGSELAPHDSHFASSPLLLGSSVDFEITFYNLLVNLPKYSRPSQISRFLARNLPQLLSRKCD